MTREELDRLRKYAEVKDLEKPPLADQAIIKLLDTIDALTRERDRLALEAKAGRELRDKLNDEFAGTRGIDWFIDRYDTSTKGSTHE